MTDRLRLLFIAAAAGGGGGRIPFTNLRRSRIKELGGAPSASVNTPFFSKMSFHFASSEYAKCFQGLPTPDVPKLRSSAIEYLDAFDKDLWYKDPVSEVKSSHEKVGRSVFLH